MGDKDLSEKLFTYTEHNAIDHVGAAFCLSSRSGGRPRYNTEEYIK